jgi:hypothetical protein
MVIRSVAQRDLVALNHKKCRDRFRNETVYQIGDCLVNSIPVEQPRVYGNGSSDSVTESCSILWCTEDVSLHVRKLSGDCVFIFDYGEYVVKKEIVG